MDFRNFDTVGSMMEEPRFQGHPNSPMNCDTSSPTLGNDWRGDPSQLQNSNDIQSYIRRISQLESKLQMAQNEIFNLQQQIRQQEQKEDKKPKQAQSRYWTDEEHQRFLEALERFGHKDVKAIANYVGSRNPTQVRTHAQKYFLRLERERQKEEEKIQSPEEATEFESSAQVDRFLNAIKATAFEPDFHRRCVLINERFMPETSIEEIKSWLFVHKKTVEKIQVTEAQNAAKSVGAKRLRSSSNPVTVSQHRTPHNLLSTQDDYFPKNSFVTAAVPTTALAQSTSGNFYKYPPPTSQFPPSQTTTNYPLQLQTSPMFEQRPRPQSLPAGNFNPNGILFDHQINFFDSPGGFPMLDPYTPDTNPFQTIPTHSHLPSHIKPYIPGAPPPSSPAPPPPQYH